MKEEDLIEHDKQFEEDEEEEDENEEKTDMDDPEFDHNLIDQVKYESDDNITVNIIDDEDDKESDVDEKEFTRISIHNEKFVKTLNNCFLILISYGFAFLITILISSFFNHNIFPFKIQDMNHWATQVGYIVFFASYWTTNVILLRLLIIIGYIFFTVSAFLTDSIPYMDVLTWTYIFVSINFKQILKILYDDRPIVFDSFREKIYLNVFKGIMKRSDFKTLTKNSLLRDLSKDRYYAKFGDRCSNLSILIYGKMKVYRKINNENLYDDNNIFINENEFIDSSQWMLRKNKKKGKRFTYSIQAFDNCKYLTWPREMLQELLDKNPELEQPLLGALGIDVSHKVLQNES